MSDIVRAYCIRAGVETTSTGACGSSWSHTRWLPLFYLLPDVQGIVSEQHAQSIATNMLAGIVPAGAVLHVTATDVEVTPNAHTAPSHGVEVIG